MSGKSKNGGATPIPVADDYALVLAQERMVVEAQVAIHRLLRRAGLKQSDLAALLGISEARVSQMFSGNARNLTLRSLARIFHVLGTRCRIVDEADMRAAEASDAPTADAVAHAADPEPAAAPEVSAATDESSFGSEVYSPRVADAWLLGGRDLFEMLSEDAPFASQMVWVSDQKIVPANENHPSFGDHGRRAGTDVRRWAAAQDQYAFG